MKASSESGLWATVISRVCAGDTADSAGMEVTLTAGDPFKRNTVAGAGRLAVRWIQCDASAVRLRMRAMPVTMAAATTTFSASPARNGHTASLSAMLAG